MGSVRSVTTLATAVRRWRRAMEGGHGETSPHTDRLRLSRPAVRRGQGRGLLLWSELHVINRYIDRARDRGATVGNLRHRELPLDADDLRSVGLRPAAEILPEHRVDHGWSRRRNRDSALGRKTVAVGNASTGWGVCRGKLVEGLDLQIDVAPRRRSGNGERKRVECGDGCARVEAESCASEGP